MTPFANRKTLDDANALMTAYGGLARPEAATRADRSRNCGNTIHFCHWRQVERLIIALSSEQVSGTIH